MEFFQTIDLYQKYEKSLELGTMPFLFLYSTDFTETKVRRHRIKH